MFKKPVKISAQNQLSGKDKKVIKSKLLDNMNEACVQKLLAINDKMICCKISGSKMLIYMGDQYPLLVDGTGKNNYFPSLYVAAAFQPLMKTLTLNEGVQTYIYNGANLMWPGVKNYEGLGQFLKDQVIGIRNSKGQIIAIGAMGASKKQLTDMSGVAVYILHYYGDKLWQMGTKTYPQVIISLPVVEVKQQQPKLQAPKQQPKVQQKKQTKLKQDKNIKQVKQKQSQQKQGQQKASKQVKGSKKQKTPQPSPPKTPVQSSQSDDADEFLNLVHSKAPQKARIVQMQKPNNLKNAFIEDQNQQKGKKNKKKGGQAPLPAGKKGGKKKQQSQEDQNDVMQEQEQIKPNQKDNKKGGKKKNVIEKPQNKKGKKQQSDQQQEQKPNKKESEGEEQQKSQQKSAINSKLMDQYFKQSLFNAIKLSKVEAQLPIDSGKFFMDYMILAKPQGVKLQIKDSTYKKIGKFFEQMAKKKILQYKHPKDKKAQGAQITKIFWENQDLKNWVPTVKKLASKQEEQKVQNYSKAKLKLSKTVALQTVYKPNQQLFDNVLKKPLNLMPEHSDQQVTDKQQIQYVTQKELKEAIEKYINKISQNIKQKQKQTKQKDEKKKQKTDKLLLIDYNKHTYIKQLLNKQIQEYEENKEKDNILKQDQGSEDQGDKKKKKIKKTGSQGLFKVQRNYLVDKLFAKALPYHHVFDKETGLDRFKQGQFKGIQIIAEKSNNKNITKISGLQHFIIPKQQTDDQIHGFVNQLQLKFACSVNIQNLPGKNAGKQIIVHGAFLDQLQEIFAEEHQIPNKFITTQNKLDKKKKN